jgi:hypothetical protein
VKYQRTQDGFFVYSIGKKRQVEGGLGYEAGMPHDDLAIPIPLPDGRRIRNWTALLPRS